MKILISVLIMLLVFENASSQVGHECSSRIFTDLVVPLGYPVEEHQVVTADGYILRVFRMQAKGSDILNDGKPVVILQHGNEDCSDGFVVNDEDKAPGFFLANNGFDVWLPNNRGNKYSIKNEKISRFSKSFWDFSFQEMGNRDQPAIVEYILRVTGRKKLVYIGHSQGTTQMFAGLSDPASTDFLNQKVSKFIALAPVVYATNITNKSLKTFADNPMILTSYNFYGMYQVFPAGCSIDTTLSAFMSYLCTFANWFCVKILSGADLEPSYDNTNRLNVFFAHSPNGASVRGFQHFTQMFNEPKTQPMFRMFDFGRYENMKKYGQSDAPVYDFKNIKIPVTLFTGLKDTLADPEDSKILLSNLETSGVDVKMYKYEQWGHMTYNWGNNPKVFFEDLLKEIRSEATEDKEIV